MQTYVEPENQHLYSIPYEHAHYTFNGPDTIEAYRTCRYLNHNLKLFVNTGLVDEVVSGFPISHLNVDDNDMVSVTFGSGKLIQDMTLITAKPFTLSFDATHYMNVAEDYWIVVYTNYQFASPTTIPDTDPSPFSFNIGMYNSLTEEMDTSCWNPAKNRLILFAAPLSNLNDNRSSIKIKGVPEWYDVYYHGDIDGGIIL